MTTNRELDEILAEIGREHRAIAAPRRLETELRNATESRKDGSGARKLRAMWSLAGAAILVAAIATGGAILRDRKSERQHDRQARSVPAQPAGPNQPLSRPTAATHADIATVSVRPRSAGPGHARLREVSPGRATGNSLDEFVPLPVSEGLAPSAELSVVRVRLQGSDLQQYGLEAPADGFARTMLAEFAVGEDGLPRAIRIVR